MKDKSACILMELLAEGQFVRQHGHCGFGISEAIRVTAGGLKQWLTSLVNSLISEWEFTMAVLRILAKKLNNAGRRLEEAVLSLGIIVLAIFLIANAIGRKAGLLIYFVDELAVFLVILITFVGLSYAVRKARHVRMAAIYDLVPEKIQKVMMLIISFVTALVMFYMAYLATTYVLQVYSWGQIAPTLRMPYWIGIVIVPVGFFFAGIYYVLTFAKNISTEGAAWSGSEQQSEYE